MKSWEPIQCLKTGSEDVYKRQPQALKIDFEIRPPYFEVSPTHRARTWLLDPRAPKVEPPALIARMFEKWKEAAPDVQ